jgi:hypothetical protein
MRERREHQEEEIDAAARHECAQAMQDGTAQRSSGGGSRRSAGGSSGGGDGPSAAFYERQQALLERRKQREAQRRPSDEDELEECVCEWLQESGCMQAWHWVLAGTQADLGGSNLACPPVNVEQIAGLIRDKAGRRLFNMCVR